MSSIGLSRALIGALFSFVGSTALAAGSQLVLSCENQKVESIALKQAPKGARRVSEHVLEVTSQKGPQRFVDKPPYDELGGARWRYCGYDALAKVHLIEVNDESAYSGDLLWEETGKLLRAGHTVLFSPNRQAFLSIEQEDGMDGERWTVYDIRGKPIWKGYAGTVAKVDGVDSVVSTFAHPQWTQKGELTARFACTSSKTNGVVTLARSPSGSWSWRGHAKCA
jgi:hypothetical protein